MAKKATMLALHKFAMTLPDAEEGIACAGTVIEKRTAKVNKRAFLFLGLTDAMVKLDGSYAEAEKLAAKAPDNFVPGKGGWTKIVWTDDKPPPMAVMKRWIKESHGLQAVSSAKPKKKSR
jgi:hypothetical protein